MAKIEIVETPKLIATRVPPGDNWQLVGETEVVDSLVMALTQYMRKNQFKGNYRLEPFNGKRFAIHTYEETVEEPEPMIFDLYGEGPDSQILND